MKCNKCGDSLVSKDSLKQHYRNVHDTRYEDTLKDTEDCPTCGKSYETMQSVKIHHTKSHNESLSMVEVSCDWCDDSFKRQESTIKDQEKVFCDQQCHGYWKSENLNGDDHWNYNSVKVSCDFCGDTLTRAVSDIYGQVFCGNDCMAGWLSENIVGENHPNWKGGSNDYGEGWESKRREAIKRANGVCEHPNCKRVESRCGRSLDVHHIVPFRLIDDTNKANKLSNLLVLCQEHHAEVEP